MTTAAMTPPALSPVSLTFMPEYLHRSPSSSSLNTRQRSDFEESQSTPVARSPWSSGSDAMVLEGEGEALQDNGEDHAPVEMPFASEPALEGELEQELPPLKKLKPSGGGEEGGLASEVGVKGILARKASQQSNGSAEGSPMELERQPSTEALTFSPSALPIRPGMSTLTPLSLSTLGSDLRPQARAPSSSQQSLSSRPMSRRSSSGGSSNGSSALKAVRFASGNGFSSASSTSTPTAIWTSEDEHWSSSHELSDGGLVPDKDDERVTSPIEFEGPVAAVVYLTHSREAYDRSPIVVDDEGNLSLPPRERKAGERGWIRCGKKRVGLGKPPASGGLVGAANLDHEAKALRKQKEKLRQEIEALGRAGLVGDAGTGASPLLRNIGLSERPPIEEDEEDDAREAPTPKDTASTSAWAMQVTNSSSSLSTLRNETVDFEDPNVAVAPPPNDVDLADIVSEVGEENPGDDLSDDGSVGSDGEGGPLESMDGDAEGEDSVHDDEGEDDAPQDDDDEEDAAEDDEDEEDPEEEGERRRRRQMGMCGMGKWSRGDVFNMDDALGGF